MKEKDKIVRLNEIIKEAEKKKLNLEKKQKQQKEEKKEKESIPEPPINEDSKRITLKTKDRKWLYYVPISLIILLILVNVLLWLVFNVAYIWKIISTIISIPIFLLSIVLLFVKLYLDRKKISGNVKTKFFTNYLVVNIFKENGRLEKDVILINKDGKTFNWKGGLYTVDLETIWYDESKHPNSYYKQDIPNPLLFDFDSLIEKSIAQINTGEENAGVFQHKGRTIDLSYSSKNLQMFKKEKMLDEFHRNPDSEKMLYAVLGLVGLLVIGIIVIAVIK